MSFVLDASITLAWYFDDERTEASDAVLDRVTETGAIAPALWRYEVANGLQTAFRRKRIDRGHRDASLAELRLLPIEVDRVGENSVWTAMLDFADRFKLTIYDAAYLEVAARRRLPLATGDRALRAAARGLEIELIAAKA